MIESSQATAKHMKQVTRDSWALQVNLLRHQHTEIPPSKSKKKNKTSKFRQEANKFLMKNQESHKKIEEDLIMSIQDKMDVKNVVTPSIEKGFRYPASKHQCKICHKYGHFSTLCYKKREKYDNLKRSFGSPKAHQLKIGLVYTQDPLCSKSKDYSSEGDSFCLQLQVQSSQAETNCIAPQHLVTNLDNKLKPYKKKTKFLRARIDTYANVNLMPISVYKFLYKDPDSQQLATSNKSNVKSSSTEKTQIVGSHHLFVLHPDTKCLQEVTYQVTSHKGSIIISCATSLELGLIQPHRWLDVVPEKGSLIYSTADLPVKQ